MRGGGSLADSRHLAELQAEEHLVDPALVVTPIDHPNFSNGSRPTITILLLTHSEPRLHYSYRNVQFFERQIVGISVFTSTVDGGGGGHQTTTTSTDQLPQQKTIGVIMRKKRPAYTPYPQYQKRLSDLIVRDKFYNERNLSALKNHTACGSDVTEAVQQASRSVSSSSTYYTICEIDDTASILSESFVMLYNYVRINGINVMGHRLTPKLSWIANAFERYCAERNYPLTCVKLNLTSNNIVIHPDCDARENHNSAMCEVCIFHSYLNKIRQETATRTTTTTTKQQKNDTNPIPSQ